MKKKKTEEDEKEVVQKRIFDIQIRSTERAEDDGKMTLIGHAALFNSRTNLYGNVWEEILPGAFDGRLNDDVRALLNHDQNMVLGRTKSGTVRLSVDSSGLKTEIDLPNTTLGKDVFELVKRGDISQMSFSFSMGRKDADIEETGDGKTLIKIRKISKLYDVSPVTFPAYEDTRISARSFISAAEEESKNHDPSVNEIMKRKWELYNLELTK